MKKDTTPITVPIKIIPDSERVEVKDIFSKIDEYEASIAQEEPETVIKPIPTDPLKPNEIFSNSKIISEETTEEIVKKIFDEKYNQLNIGKESIAPAAIERPKTSWLWIKNSNGESSASITFLYIAFWITTAMFILGHIGEINIGDAKIAFNEFDSTAAAVYYVPLMMLYFKRREFESDKPGRPGLLELALTRDNQRRNDQDTHGN